MPVFVRTNQEVKEIATLDPFKDSRCQSADVNIVLLADTLDEARRASSRPWNTVTDGFLVRRREILLVASQAGRHITLFHRALTKALTQPFTIRSTNTMWKLAAKW